MVRTLRIVVSLLFLSLTLSTCGGGGGGGGGGEATTGAPIATVSSATSVTQNGASLNGSVTPNGLATTAWFEYGTDAFLSTYTSTAVKSLGDVITTSPVVQAVTGFTSGTAYFFRVCGSNAQGTTKSAIASFTTSAPGSAPAVTTLAATSVSANGATLNGNVTPNGLATSAWFEWGTDFTLFTSTSTSSQSVGSGSISVSVNAALTGLTTGTTYYYRVAASNSSGTSTGNILSFMTGIASDEWTATGRMVAPRYMHTMTLLQNGKVLVTGGSNDTGELSSSELYDPATGTWSATGSMVVARSQHAATLLPDGKVLVAGGNNNSDYGILLSSAELYDPGTGTWTATGSMAVERLGHTATLLLNGKVLVAGGSGFFGSLSSAELYDPATGTWASTGLMAADRIGNSHTAILLPNGKVLVTGGFTNNFYPWLSSAELYDPNTGTWAATGSMAAVRAYHKATLLPNGKVLVAGGINPDTLSSAELYDPATGTWSVTGSMAAARIWHTATLLLNGKTLVAGGSGISGWLSSAELYDPDTGTWAATGSMATSIGHHEATLLPNGKVLVAGGYSSEILYSAELYNP